MQRDKIRQAAEALAGLTNMEWTVLKEAVDMQFDRKVHLLSIGTEDAQQISDRIEREWAGMLEKG